MDRVLKSCIEGIVKLGGINHGYGPGFYAQFNIDPHPYDDAYYETYTNYRYSDISADLNDFRRCVCRSPHVLDIGVGDCAFLDTLQFEDPTGIQLGFDINPTAIASLKATGRWLDPYTEDIPDEIQTVTFWDSLEHIPDPHLLFDRLGSRTIVVSIPVFRKLRHVESSRHFKPHEHLYYFTQYGLIWWLSQYNYSLDFASNQESVIGRHNIMTYRFSRP